MSTKVSNVVCINTRLEVESRRLTLFWFLKFKGISYHYITPSLDTRSTKVGQRLVRRHYIIPHVLSLLDSFSIVLTLIPHVISYIPFIATTKRITIIVCFNSWYLYPIAFIFSFLPKVRVVVDLGYPIADISTIGLPYNFKSIIGFLEKLVYSRPISILVESKEQQARLQANYCNPKFYTFYVLNSSGLSPNSNTINPISQDLSTEYRKYILFRGTLNPESGIIDIVKEFIDFKNKNPSSDINLFIKGSGEYASFVRDKASEYDYIIFIDSHLDSNSLTTLMVESEAMIGQFGTSDTRLNYTIPHKFIEAIKLRKLYLSPLSLPIEEYYRLLLPSDEFELLRQSNRPLSFWLPLMNDIKRVPNSRRITHVSSIVEDHLTTVNINSLASCNL
jgi:hypothetical protein